MPQWQGKSKGNKLGYQIFIFIIEHVGVKGAYVLLRFVAFYYFLFSWSSSRHIYRYFRERHHLSKIKSLFKVYANYYVFGQTLLDKIVVMSGVEDQFTFDFDGEEYLHKMVEGGKGGILMSAHVGNWEVAGHLLKRLNTRINVIMFDAEHQKIKDYLQHVTGGRKFNVIVIKDDLSHVYEIGNALQRNELVCIHADRFLPGNKVITQPILGSEAYLPLGPFQLSEGFNVPVSIVFAFKETATHYHFYGSTLYKRHENDVRGGFATRLASAFAVEVNEKIKRYPEQWFNYYNFWDTNIETN